RIGLGLFNDEGFVVRSFWRYGRAIAPLGNDICLLIGRVSRLCIRPFLFRILVEIGWIFRTKCHRDLLSASMETSSSLFISSPLTMLRKLFHQARTIWTT